MALRVLSNNHGKGQPQYELKASSLRQFIACSGRIMHGKDSKLACVAMLFFVSVIEKGFSGFERG
jgi:hypothetical protein